MNLGAGPCDQAVIEASAERGKQPCREGWVLLASILGSSMAFVDANAVNVALPALQSSFHVSLTSVQWVVEAYALFLGALLLTGGSLGDRYGHARVFIAGTVLFAGGSVCCGLAPHIRVLIASRALQGLGGALLVPTSLALISVYYPRERVGTAIGTWSAATSITSAAGPLLGGWLTQHASWRWVFFINIPISLIAVTVALVRIPSAPASKEGHIDWGGTVLAALGLGGLVYSLLQSSLAIGLASLVALTGFVLVEGREKNPMLPLGLFRSSDFTGTSFLTLFLYGALSGAMFFLPLDLVQAQGYSESAAGAALMPVILMVAGFSRWSAKLVERFSVRKVLIGGPLMTGLGFGLLALPSRGHTYWQIYLPGLVVIGLGLAATVAPLTTAVMASVDKSRVGVASGVNNAISRVAGLVSIAGMGVALRQFEGPGLHAGFRAVQMLACGLAVLAAVSAALLIRAARTNEQ